MTSKYAQAGRRFYGEWADLDAMLSDFGITEADIPGEILFATYTHESYSGSCRVVGRRDDETYWVVEASHCSCNGFEDDWKPDDTTPGALMMMSADVGYDGDADSITGWTLFTASFHEDYAWEATLNAYRELAKKSKS